LRVRWPPEKKAKWEKYWQAIVKKGEGTAVGVAIVQFLGLRDEDGHVQSTAQIVSGTRS
jgi:hypothetical protein